MIAEENKNAHATIARPVRRQFLATKSLAYKMMTAMIGTFLSLLKLLLPHQKEYLMKKKLVSQNCVKEKPIADLTGNGMLLSPCTYLVLIDSYVDQHY